MGFDKGKAMSGCAISRLPTSWFAVVSILLSAVDLFVSSMIEICSMELDNRRDDDAFKKRFYSIQSTSIANQVLSKRLPSNVDAAGILLVSASNKSASSL